ncbi:MAG TPA: YbgC/FadM family acyl-CoA thioesterase [Burkholderiaceae bacterium]|nr:YbgC/FadM family acyl-CoA thioesterase [Burkholderiaceae bacterium]
MSRGTRPLSSLAALPAPVFETRVRVYYEDTDAGGIVYHANWLRYFERARTDWLRALGAVHRELASVDGVLLVVRDLFIDYRLPARLDDELRIDVRLLETRRASLRLMQSAHDLVSGRLLVQAEMRVAAIGAIDQRAAGLPRWLLERLAPPQPSAPPQELDASEPRQLDRSTEARPFRGSEP